MEARKDSGGCPLTLTCMLWQVHACAHTHTVSCMHSHTCLHSHTHTLSHTHMCAHTYTYSLIHSHTVWPQFIKPISQSPESSEATSEKHLTCDSASEDNVRTRSRQLQLPLPPLQNNSNCQAKALEAQGSLQ